mgnify:CR=1 FL=1
MNGGLHPYTVARVTLDRGELIDPRVVCEGCWAKVYAADGRYLTGWLTATAYNCALKK